MERSIEKKVLYVNEILTTKCEEWGRCLSSNVNCVYYGFKSCVFVNAHDLWISERSVC